MKALGKVLVFAVGLVTSAVVSLTIADTRAASGSAVCGDPTTARLQVAQGMHPVQPDYAAATVTGAYKATHDPSPSEAHTGATPAQLAANIAEKAQWRQTHSMPKNLVTYGQTDADLVACANSQAQLPALARTRSFDNLFTNAYAGIVVSGPGYAYLNYVNQQGQINDYYCGPATVSESAWTEFNSNRLSNPVNQSTAGAYMGTNPNDGTTAAGLLSGMQTYVGMPTVGWSFYVRVDIAYTPTQADRDNWANNLQNDVLNSAMPVASVAWEAYNGPHLNGHPNLTQDIFHIVQTYGYNWNQGVVYYADSATTVWAGVPALSAYSNYDFVTIMGGRGYNW